MVDILFLEYEDLGFLLNYRHHKLISNNHLFVVGRHEEREIAPLESSCLQQSVDVLASSYVDLSNTRSDGILQRTFYISFLLCDLSSEDFPLAVT